MVDKADLFVCVLKTDTRSSSSLSMMVMSSVVSGLTAYLDTEGTSSLLHWLFNLRMLARD